MAYGKPFNQNNQEIRNHEFFYKYIEMTMIILKRHKCICIYISLFILLIIFGGIGFLSFGPPEWDFHIFYFQTHIFPRIDSADLQEPPKRFTGTWTFWHENGIPYYSVECIDGVYYGKYKKWYESGVLECEEYYKKGLENGKSLWWYKNGARESELYYKNGKKEGIERYWLEDGTLSAEREYQDGQLNGRCSIYYDDGKIQESVEYLKGKKCGISLYYCHSEETWATIKVFWNDQLVWKPDERIFPQRNDYEKKNG